MAQNYENKYFNVNIKNIYLINLSPSFFKIIFMFKWHYINLYDFPFEVNTFTCASPKS